MKIYNNYYFKLIIIKNKLLIIIKIIHLLINKIKYKFMIYLMIINNYN